MGLSILQWNANSLVAHLSELKHFLDEIDSLPDVICVQETRLSDKHNSIKINGYTLLRRDGKNGHGGVAIFLKNDISYSELKCYDTVEGISVNIQTVTGPLQITNFYVSPSMRFDETFFQTLFDRENIFVCGDFNAKSSLWGSPKSDNRGKSIENILQKSNLVVLNTGLPTRIFQNGCSHIDLAFASPRFANKSYWDVIDSTCGSDHNLINIELETFGEYEQISPPRWLFDKADWSKFSTLCDINLSAISFDGDLETLSECMTDAINNAAMEAIPRTTGKTKRRHAMFWNEKCEKAVRDRDKAKRALKIGSPQSQFIEYKRLKAIANRTIKTEKRNSWKGYCQSLSHRTKLGKVWNAVKNMNGTKKGESIPALDTSNGLAKTNKEKANVFARHYSKISSTTNYNKTFRTHKENFEQEHKPIFNKRRNSTSVLNVPFKLSELKKALRKCKNTAPGKDMICYEMFRHMSASSQEHVLKFFNLLWHHGFLPSSWRHALIVPILKPNKSKNEPASYRPIALTSNFCKLFERILVCRLTWYLEKHQILSKFQSGFRKRRNTVDQLLRLSDDILKNLGNDSRVLGVFIDFEKAYDMVWTKGVLFKMHQLGVDGNMFNFVNAFLHGRTIQVRVGTTLSDNWEVENGLPQGGVLSPVLFLIAINDLPLDDPHIKHSLFADDVAIWKSGKNIKFLECQMQTLLNKVQTWCNLWGFKISVTKSCFVLFQKRKGKKVQLTLNGQNMVREKSVKFLGMVFDESLTWKDHITLIIEKCQKRINVLKSLTGTKWGAGKETMVILYKTLVRSIIDYGSEVYHSASDSVLQKLDVVQSQCLRIICGAMKCTAIPALEVECGIPPLALRREYCLHKIAVKYAASDGNPTQECFEDSQFLYYGKYKGQFQPIGLKVQDCLKQIPELYTNTLVDNIPPWEYNQPCFDVQLHETVNKKSDNPHFVKALSLEHMSKYCTSLHIYTDGSKCERKSGCAFCVPSLQYSKSIRLSDGTSVFIAEMVAILEALRFLLTKPPLSCVIFSDSLSAIQSIESGSEKWIIHQEIKYCFHQLSCIGVPVTICWIPSHVDIRGNEMADKFAKQALVREHVDFPTLKEVSDLTKELKNDMLQKWQKLWDKSSKGRFYFRIQPEVSLEVKYSDHHRHKETTITRLRFGKCLLGDTLYLLGIRANNLCETCHVKEDVPHFLLHCSEYEEYMVDRNNRILNVGKNVNIESLLGDSKLYRYLWEYIVLSKKSL